MQAHGIAAAASVAVSAELHGEPTSSGSDGGSDVGNGSDTNGDAQVVDTPPTGPSSDDGTLTTVLVAVGSCVGGAALVAAFLLVRMKLRGGTAGEQLRDDDFTAVSTAPGPQSRPRGLPHNVRRRPSGTLEARALGDGEWIRANPVAGDAASPCDSPTSRRRTRGGSSSSPPLAATTPSPSMADRVSRARTGSTCSDRSEMSVRTPDAAALVGRWNRAAVPHLRLPAAADAASRFASPTAAGATPPRPSQAAAPTPPVQRSPTGSEALVGQSVPWRRGRRTTRPRLSTASANGTARVSFVQQSRARPSTNMPFASTTGRAESPTNQEGVPLR